MTNKPWYINFEALKQPAVRLFCFPYAGGSAAVYRTFAAASPPGVEVWAANLPGHGSRLAETPQTNVPSLAQELAQALMPLIPHAPFAFFGYSLGALLAFETARVLRRQGRRLPLHFYVAAAIAPQLSRPARAWHRLPAEALLAELHQYQGVPQAVLDEPELAAYFLPGLRADLQMVETAVYMPERPFDFPITTFGGNQDPLVHVEELRAWREQTRGPFQQILLEAGHFFLTSSQALITQRLAADLLQEQTKRRSSDE